MNGFCCNKCKFVFPLADALTEYVNLMHGGPATRYCCPECQSTDLRATHVCPECLREELVTGEDLGRKCLQAEQDALADMLLEQTEDHSRRTFTSFGLRRVG